MLHSDSSGKALGWPENLLQWPRHWIVYGLTVSALVSLCNAVSFGVRGADLAVFAGLGGLVGIGMAQTGSYGYVLHAGPRERLWHGAFSTLTMTVLVMLLTGFRYPLVASAAGAIHGLNSALRLQPAENLLKDFAPWTILERSSSDVFLARFALLGAGVATAGLLTSGYGHEFPAEHMPETVMVLGVLLCVTPQYRQLADREKWRVANVSRATVVAALAVWLTWLMW